MLPPSSRRAWASTTQGGTAVACIHRPAATATKRCCATDCIATEDDGEFQTLACTNKDCPEPAAHAVRLQIREEQMVLTLCQQRSSTMNEHELGHAIYRSKFGIARPLWRCAARGKGALIV